MLLGIHGHIDHLQLFVLVFSNLKLKRMFLLIFKTPLPKSVNIGYNKK